MRLLLRNGKSVCGRTIARESDVVTYCSLKVPLAAVVLGTPTKGVFAT